MWKMERVNIISRAQLCHLTFLVPPELSERDRIWKEGLPKLSLYFKGERMQETFYFHLGQVLEGSTISFLCVSSKLAISSRQVSLSQECTAMCIQEQPCLRRVPGCVPAQARVPGGSSQPLVLLGTHQPFFDATIFPCWKQPDKAETHLRDSPDSRIRSSEGPEKTADLSTAL